jgi:hypothetical protein
MHLCKLVVTIFKLRRKFNFTIKIFLLATLVFSNKIRNNFAFKMFTCVWNILPHERFRLH